MLAELEERFTERLKEWARERADLLDENAALKRRLAECEQSLRQGAERGGGVPEPLRRELEALQNKLGAVAEEVRGHLAAVGDVARVMAEAVRAAEAIREEARRAAEAEVRDLLQSNLVESLLASRVVRLLFQEQRHWSDRELEEFLGDVVTEVLGRFRILVPAGSGDPQASPA
jgi:chromosome segregation ATPase